METTILDWLINLISNRGLYDDFLSDPEGVVQQSNLTEPQRRVLLSRDLERIRHVIEYEENIDPAAQAMHLIFPIQMHNHSEPTST
jgi:hypothetical protein